MTWIALNGCLILLKSRFLGIHLHIPPGNCRSRKKQATEKFRLKRRSPVLQLRFKPRQELSEEGVASEFGQSVQVHWPNHLLLLLPHLPPPPCRHLHLLVLGSYTQLRFTLQSHQVNHWLRSWRRNRRHMVEMGLSNHGGAAIVGFRKPHSGEPVQWVQKLFAMLVGFASNPVGCFQSTVRHAARRFPPSSTQTITGKFWKCGGRRNQKKPV